MSGRLLGAILLLTFLGAYGCGGGGSRPGELTAQQVIERSAQRFDSVKSFHFELDHDKGTTDIILGLGLDTAVGDFVLPDRMSAEASGKFGPTTVRVKIVAIGERTWITNPFTREFQRAPGNASILDSINPAALIRAVAAGIIDPEFDGSQSIDGVDCYYIRGSISSDDLGEALSFADSGLTLQVEAWVGKQDFLVRRARLKGPLLPNENKEISREITLSKFDAAVTIEEPR